MNYTPIKFNSFEERQEYLYDNYTKILGIPVLDKLVQQGFLTAPASTKYHGSYEGGLFDHSANVAHVLQLLTENNNLVWQTDPKCESIGGESSPLLIGMMHDLCKIDLYKKNIECSRFDYNNDPIIKGHGTKSVMYLYRLGLYHLTEEEVACIVYHMGAYTPQEEWESLRNAIRKFPNVLWTHTADMIASQIMEV